MKTQKITQKEIENTKKGEPVANSLKIMAEQLYRKVNYMKRVENICSNIKCHLGKSIRKLRSLSD